MRILKGLGVIEQICVDSGGVNLAGVGGVLVVYIGESHENAD